MKTIPFILSGLLLFTGVTAQTIAPQTVNATGGSSRKGNLRLDWSVGEMALVNTLSDPFDGNIITNGVIQPQIAVTKKGNTKHVSFTKSEIRILPNPTQGMLQVSIRMKQEGKTVLRLYDETGRLRYSATVTTDRYEQTERINMGGYMRGNYMLYVEFVSTYGYTAKEAYYKIVKID
jgi:hypothetical protein